MNEQWVRRPTGDAPIAALISVPHYGTQALPGIRADDYAEPANATFAYGYADAFAADLYDGLEATGATMLVFPWSRLFVDTNRPRDDFEIHHGRIRSKRGVIRTHSIADTELFAEPLSAAQAEQRLQQFYDPYHHTLRQLIERLHQQHGHLLLVDAHTGSERRMGDHQVILGTRRGVTIAPRLSDLAARVFSGYGFRVRHDVPGYSGGFTVRHYGEPLARQIHALQIEVNSTLLMAGTRQDFMAAVRSGELPARDESNLARLRACVSDVVAALAADLPEPR